jgi:triosephosphate isomerase (TIM)
MRTKVIAGNWKMNYTIEEGLQVISRLKELNPGGSNDSIRIILIPPFTHLSEFGKSLKNSGLFLGAQNIHQLDKGAYTGEISGLMIKSTGAEYVVIGHSERRQYFNEDNVLLALKIKKALEIELKPIYCCGETLDERNRGIHFEIVSRQLKEGIFDLSPGDFKKIIIAYEPVWAIGTGVNASPEQAQEMHHYIRELIAKNYKQDLADEIILLYGGSIKSSNSKELFVMPDIDGGLVGGASLLAEEFSAIIKSA